jgi:ribosomal protein L37AE/L43A
VSLFESKTDPALRAIPFADAKREYDNGNHEMIVSARYPCKVGKSYQGCPKCKPDGAAIVHVERRESGALVLKCAYCGANLEGGKYHVGLSDKLAVNQKERMFSQADRWKILVRDNVRCFACGHGPDVDQLEIDHIIPHAKGGPTSLLNGITLCQSCNAGKSAGIFTELIIRALIHTHRHDFSERNGRDARVYESLKAVASSLTAWGAKEI